MGCGGGRRRLYGLITRYRAEVRADLLERFGVDLAQWWRQRRFRSLLELIDQLPGASRYSEAIQNDPEQAQMIAQAREEQAGDEPEPWSPRVADYDLHAHLLRDLIQSVLGLQTAVVAAAGGKPGSTPTYPGPKTEVDRAIEALNEAWARDLAARFGFAEDDF